MFLDEAQDELGFVVQGAGKPPRSDFDAMLVHGFNFFFKAWNMLRAVVIRESLDTELVEHFCPLLRIALLRIEWHDAPRDQVVLCEHGSFKLLRSAWSTKRGPRHGPSHKQNRYSLGGKERNKSGSVRSEAKRREGMHLVFAGEK